MRHYRIALDGRTFDVKVLSDPQQDRVEVEVDGQAFTVEIKSVATTAEAVRIEPAAVVVETGAPGSIKSPLPGVIKSIAVRPGQKVAVDDELLVIEAMKMDNVIRAQRAGIISAIHVTEGHQVAHGEALLDYGA